jgi:hypothetical protein
MVETTLGISNKTWSLIELSSAGLLAVITARTTYKEVKRARGLANYLRPKGDAWRSATTYSNVLITLLLVKGAIDAAKSHDVISGLSRPKIAGVGGYNQLPNNLGTMNYF